MKRFLIVFAKEPQKGRVKTRLAQQIGDEKSLSLYQAFLKDTLNLALAVKADIRILAYESFGQKPEYLTSVADGFDLYEQEGNDLGEKMHQAFGFAKGLGAGSTIIIGSDSPTLPLSFVEEGFQSLENADVVLGPTKDGGYYLIGQNEPADGLFDNITWSSDSVLEKTIRNAEKIQKNAVLLERWYDIDTWKDFKSLQQKLLSGSEPLPPCTKKFLESVA